MAQALSPTGRIQKPQARILVYLSFAAISFASSRDVHRSFCTDAAGRWGERRFSSLFGEPLAVKVTADSSLFESVYVIIGPDVAQASPQTAPPYLFSLPIPANTPPRHYSLTALGIPKSGYNAVVSVPIDIDIECLDTPKQLTSDEQSLSFAYAGSLLPL